MYVIRKTLKLAISLSALSFFMGCSGGDSSLSTGTRGEQFAQVSNADVNIDILWVIDDSGSMRPGLDALAANTNTFINLFYNRGFNFRVAVIATSQYSGSSLFQGGVLSSTSLTQSQMASQFATNSDVGTSGTGDERGLPSMQAALSNSSNQPFPRSNAHLAVIFLADEDDCGLPSNAAACRAANPLSGFYNFLKTLTNTTDDNDLQFSTHSIVVDSNTCRSNSTGRYGADPGSPMHPAASIGTRYIDFAGLTDGLQLSICSAFGPSMASLADDLASRASQFYLQHEPIPSTIEVIISGVNGGNPIPRNTTNGWEYNESNQSISFYGTAIPPQGATIDVDYVTRFLVN